MKTIKLSGVRKNHIATAQLILDSINYDSLGESYPNAKNMDFKEICQAVVALSIRRCSFDKDKRALQLVIREYIEGLPTELALPYENYHILEWQKENNIITEHSSDKQKELAIENYWQFIPLIIKQYGA